MTSTPKKTRLFFIAGTDTDVGKTHCAVALLTKLNQSNYKTLALKPIASGCENTVEGLRNSDALALQKNSSIKAHYEDINPIAFEPAIAPHIAAKLVNKRISVRQLEGLCKGVMTLTRPDILLIEGAGGWCCPVNDTETLAGLAVALQADVILVVGMRLGCINHAILSAEAIERDGLKLAGWIANCVAPNMPYVDENIQSIAFNVNAPLLGVIPFSPSANNDVADFLDLQPLNLINFN